MKEILKRRPSTGGGIDWTAAVEILTDTELAMDRLNIDQLSEVINLGKQKPSQKDTKRVTWSDKGAKESQGGRKDKGASRGPAAADPKDTFKYGENPSMDATPAQKKQARENNACTNCLKPGHFSKNCDVRRRDGEPWNVGHIPHPLLETVHPALEQEEDQDPAVTAQGIPRLGAERSAWV